MPRTTPGSGAVFRPVFDSNYGVERIEVLNGGSGYARTDPPKVVVNGTTTPFVEGVFYPVITGIGTIREVIVFKTGSGYFPIFSNTGGGEIVVKRGSFGSISSTHSVGVSSVFTGDYNIVDDDIYFSSPPYGKQGPVGLLTGSTFSGRLFSRKLDPYDPKDKNVILDDISLDFTGVAGTQFDLSENLGIVTSVFNNSNSGVDINNNPFVLINNIVQTPGLDFEIVNADQNKINFLSGVPRAGRINKVGLQTGGGYYSLVRATAQVGVDSTGSLTDLVLTGRGQGYRSIPEISIRSSQGYGGIITATLGTNDVTTVSISTAVHNQFTGIGTFTTTTDHGYSEGDRVRIIGAGFTFTPLSAVRNISNFSYDYITGIASITVFGGHYLGVGDNQSRNVLVEGVQVTDGISTFTLREDAYPVISIGSTNDVKIMIGVGTQPLIYDSAGTVQAGVDTNILEGRDVVGFDILPGVSSNTFKVYLGITSFTHNYVTGGVVERTQAGLVTAVTISAGGTGYYSPKSVSYIDNTPSNGITTITVSGKQIGITTTISNVFYDPTTGIATIQGTNVHGLSVNDVVRLAGIAFSSTSGDVIFPPVGELRDIYSVKSIPSTIDFTVNIGVAMSDLTGNSGIHTHQLGTGTFTEYEGHLAKTDDFVLVSGIAVTFVSTPAISVYDAVYDGASGIITVTTSTNHNLSVRDFIIMSDLQLDDGVGIVTFPLSTDPYYDGTKVLTVGTSTVFSAFVGISTVSYTHDSGGTIQYAKRIASHTEEGYSGFDILESIDGANIRVFAGLTTEYYTYTRGGVIKKPIYVDITQPDPYFNRDLEYISGTSGIGTNAVVDFKVNIDGEVREFDLTEEGVAYKVGDYLTVTGISTDPRVGVVTEFRLNVTELDNDKFSAFYFGQFVLFDNISDFFDGQRKKFTLSVTSGGTTEILSLKTISGSDMDVTNNIFIYINDILQTPGESYVFKGSRVIFSEAPKPGSKCSVFYYRGSAKDVEVIEPPLTVKPGDVLQIKENKNNPFDIDQFERTGKRIVASDVLETFTYDSIGIDTNQTAERPLSWEKQRRDKIVSGTLISKARPSLKGRVIPTTRIIKNVGDSDNIIYVENAFPTFSEIDLLTQAERNAVIFEDLEVRSGILSTKVSTSSSISDISIIDGGAGYLNLTSPEVSISESLIQRKDPISDWKYDAIVGVTSTLVWKAISQTLPIVAVGESSQYINTKSGTFWERGNIGYGGTITFNAVGVGYSIFYPNKQHVVVAGEYGKVSTTVAIGNSLSPFKDVSLKEVRQVPAIRSSVTYDSDYEGTFNDVIYEGSTDTWVTVGTGGSIFVATGIGSTAFFSEFSGVLETLNSVVYAQNEYIAVGNGGAIVASNDGRIWSPKNSNTFNNIRDIIYDGSRFIYVGDSGTIGISTDKNFWQPFSQQLPAGTISPATFDFKSIKFVDGFYVGITTVGDLYYSFDLANWNDRQISHLNKVFDLTTTNFGPNKELRVIAVGSGTTVIYADPIINRATATASVTSGVITSITITNGGFGYKFGSTPPAVVESDVTKSEEILSFRTEGDFGVIVGVNTFVPGIGFSVPPRLEFTLKSDFNDNTNLGYGYSSLNLLGVDYSQLQKDDYFVIYDSPLVVGHALTGITTAIGGYANYPANKVGIISAGEYLGGVFRVERVTTPDSVSGLVTVTCAFQPGPNNNSDIQVGVGTTATIDTFWGKYSWGKIYGYQNRSQGLPKSFFVNPDAGLVGLSTAAMVSRQKPLT